MRYAIFLILLMCNCIWAQDYYLLPGKQTIFKEGVKYVKITDSVHKSISHYTFDEDGNTISYYDYYHGKLLDSMIHSYENDKVSKTTFYDDKRKVYKYYNYIYDKSNLIKYQEYEDEKLVTQKKYKYSLDKLAEVVEQNDTYHIIEKYSYNENLMTIKSFYNGKSLFKVINDFKSDTLHYHEIFEWKIDKNIPRIKYVTKYKDGNKIQFQHYYEGVEFSRYEYKYYGNELFTSDIFTDGKLRTKNFYDAYGNTISQMSLKGKSTSNYEYEYNRKGDWLKKTIYNDSKFEKVIIREIEYWD